MNTWKIIMVLIHVVITVVEMYNRDAEIIQSVREHLGSDCVFIIWIDESSAFRLMKALSGAWQAWTTCSPPVEDISGLLEFCNRPLFAVDQSISHESIIQVLSWPRIKVQPTWLLFQPITNRSLLRGAPLWIDNLVLWVHPFRKQSVRIIETYRVGIDSPILWNVYAVWSEKLGLELENKVPRNNLEGMILNAAAFESKPLMRVIHKNETGEIILDGYFGRVVNLLMEKLNFRLKITDYDEVLNRTKINAIKRLQNGKEDLVASALEMSSHRLKLFSFTAALERSTLDFFIRKPSLGDKSSWWNYFEPFPLDMWGSTALLFIIVWLFIVLVDFETHVDWIEQGVYLFSMIYCQQGHPFPLFSGSGRIILISCLLCSIVIYISYGGVLISNLAIEKINLPFENMEQMLSYGEYSLGTYNGSKVHIEFMDAKEGILQKLYAQMMDGKALPETSRQAFERVCTQHYVHIDYHIILLNPNAAKCTIVALPQYYVRATSAMGLPKNSPYRTVINHLIFEMNNFGILSRLKQLPIKKVEERKFYQVELTQIKFPLTFLCIGYCISLCVILCEILSCYIINQRKNNKNI